jgi:hypothetical protein
LSLYPESTPVPQCWEDSRPSIMRGLPSLYHERTSAPLSWDESCPSIMRGVSQSWATLFPLSWEDYSSLSWAQSWPSIMRGLLPPTHPILKGLLPAHPPPPPTWEKTIVPLYWGDSCPSIMRGLPSLYHERYPSPQSREDCCPSILRVPCLYILTGLLPLYPERTLPIYRVTTPAPLS